MTEFEQKVLTALERLTVVTSHGSASGAQVAAALEAVAGQAHRLAAIAERIADRLEATEA